ncbi:hypothetical protein LguiB_008476 [Lonicera macranthoides]
MATSNFQMQQSLQRSPSMLRLNQHQLQQQYGLAANSAAMRQQGSGMYGQMSFGQINSSNLTRSALMGQASNLPMLPAQSQPNLQSQFLALVRTVLLVLVEQFEVYSK